MAILPGGVARRRHSNTFGPVLAAIVASILAHLAMWPVGDRVVKLGRDRKLPERESTVMEVTLAPDPAREEPEADPSKIPETVRLDGIVEEERPEDAKRVAEFDNKTDREMVAPNRPKARPMTPQGNPKATDDRNAAPEPKAADAPAPRGLALPLGGTRSAGESSDRSGEGQEHKAPSVPSPALAPSPRSLKGVPRSDSKVWGEPGTRDKIDDVDEGEASILETQRWKYASFFNRMKDDIDQYWDPVARLKARDPDGRINGSKTRTTRVMIILNADGSLDKIKLEKSCNVDYLDDEALRAIRSAAPFPNPPQGMLAEDGKLHVPFGFIVEMGKGRIFRYRR